MATYIARIDNCASTDNGHIMKIPVVNLRKIRLTAIVYVEPIFSFVLRTIHSIASSLSTCCIRYILSAVITTDPCPYLDLVLNSIPMRTEIGRTDSHIDISPSGIARGNECAKNIFAMRE